MPGNGHWKSYGYQLSTKLRTLREKRGLSQAMLAEYSGVSRGLISKLERNEYGSDRSADPSLSTLYKLAQGLHVPPALLLPAVDQVVGRVCPDDPAPATPELPALPATHPHVSLPSHPPSPSSAGKNRRVAPWSVKRA